MITIKEPLKLNSLTGITVNSDSLGHKIMDNYRFMVCTMKAEDFIHVATAPIEVYIGENEGSSILNNHIQFNSNELRYELINSFINRILLLNTNHFTYQDEVFVSSFLQKIGITDVNEFIRNYKKNEEYNKTVSRLLEHYWENGLQLKELTQKLESLFLKTEEPVNKETDNRTNNYLSREIFDRVNTAFLQNVLYEFYDSRNQAMTEITAGSINMAEFINMSDRIQLLELKNLFYKENYVEELSIGNIYEKAFIPLENINKNVVLAKLSGAILCNISNELSFLLNQNTGYTAHTWINAANALYGSSENTIARFMQLEKRFEYQLEHSDRYSESIKELQNKEIELINILERLPYPEEDEETRDVQRAILTLAESRLFTEKINSEKSKHFTDKELIYEEEKTRQEIRKQIELNNESYRTIHKYAEQNSKKEQADEAVDENNASYEQEAMILAGASDRYDITQLYDSQKKLERTLSNTETSLHRELIDELLLGVSLYHNNILQKKLSITNKAYESNTVKGLREDILSQLVSLESRLDAVSTLQNRYLRESSLLTDAFIKESYEINSSSELLQSTERQYIDNVHTLREADIEYELLKGQKVDVEYTDVSLKEFSAANMLLTNTAEFKEKLDNISNHNDIEHEAYLKRMEELNKEQNRQNIVSEERTDISLEEFNGVERSFRNDAEYKEYLESMNSRNVRLHEMQQKRIEELNKVQTRQNIVVDRKTAMKQALRALENTDAVIDEVLKYAKPIEKKVDSRIISYLELAPAPVKERFEKLFQIPEGSITSIQQQKTANQIVMENVIDSRVEPIKPSADNIYTQEFYHDITTRLQKIIRESSITISDTVEISQEDTVNEMKELKEIIDVSRAKKTDKVNRIDMTDYEKQISLVHKKQTQDIGEEVLNELKQQRHMKHSDKEEITESIHTTHLIERSIEETKKEILAESHENVTQIVNQSLREQLNTITDEVYRGIEHRLASERRRRGY